MTAKEKRKTRKAKQGAREGGEEREEAGFRAGHGVARVASVCGGTRSMSYLEFEGNHVNAPKSVRA